MKLIRVTKSMPGRARNLAVAASRCQWIAFTDAGITLSARVVRGADQQSAERIQRTSCTELTNRSLTVFYRMRSDCLCAATV